MAQRITKRHKLAARRAHSKLYRAIRRGEIDPPYYKKCSDCHWSPCEYHHYTGYRWYWKVIALCRWCHRRRHSHSFKGFICQGCGKLFPTFREATQHAWNNLNTCNLTGNSHGKNISNQKRTPKRNVSTTSRVTTRT